MAYDSCTAFIFSRLELPLGQVYGVLDYVMMPAIIWDSASLNWNLYVLFPLTADACVPAVHLYNLPGIKLHNFNRCNHDACVYHYLRVFPASIVNKENTFS